MKLVAQLLALMDKTASFQPVLGETFQPGFHGMVCQALGTFLPASFSWLPLFIMRLDSREPLRCGPHRTSDQKKCLVLDFVKGLLVCLCCGRPCCGAILEMGSDCSLIHCFLYFLTCSPGGTSKFVKNSQSASGFCFCLLSKCDTKVCCFFILLQWGPTKSDGARFLFWGQDEQGGGRLLLVDCNAPFLSPVVELVSHHLHTVCGCSCIFFLAPHHQIICI